MKFYNTLQLDPIILKKYIKEAQTTKEKNIIFLQLLFVLFYLLHFLLYIYLY